MKRVFPVVGIIGAYLALVGACSDTTGSEEIDSGKADSATDSSKGDADSVAPDTGGNIRPDGASDDGATDAGPDGDASIHDGAVDDAGPDGDASIQDGAIDDADAGSADASDASDASDPTPPDAAVPECGSKCGFDPKDPLMRCTGDAPTTPVTFPADAVWANSLVQVSSEFDPDGWGGIQALGAPNVYPAHVDDYRSWATENEDAANEFITVGFPANTTGVAVWIVATYNPDAVSSVVVTTASGDTTVYSNMAPASVGSCAYVLAVPTMTNLPIQKVTVRLASDLVPAHNEIDAIGIVP